MKRTTRAERDYHSAMTITGRQAKRLAAGKLESAPSDYTVSVTAEGAAQRDARHRLEDRAAAAEAEWDW